MRGILLGGLCALFLVVATPACAELHCARQAGNSYVTFEDGSMYGLTKQVDCHVGEMYDVQYVGYGMYQIVHPKSGNVVGAVKVAGPPRLR